MKYNRVKEWLLRITLILVVITIVSIVYANYELKHMFGGYTKVVSTAQFDVVAEPTAIKNVNILSPDASHFIENQTVLIDKGKIISIGPDIRIPQNNIIIDGQSKYLIPGLINSHVHLWQSPNDLLLYLANGITHIREMMGSTKHLKWRKEIKDGKRLGPKIFVASNKVQSFGVLEGWFMNWSQGNINLNDTSKSLVTLQSLYDEGYDAIKLGSFLDKDNYKAVGMVANKIDIPLIGHLSLSVGLNELWTSKQKEIAHIEEIIKALRKEFGKVNTKNKNDFLQFIEKRSCEVSDNLIKNNIAITSTLWLTESFIKQKFKLQKLLKEIELSYVNPGIIEGTVLTSRTLGWLPRVNVYRLPTDITSERLAKEKNYWTVYAEAAHILVKIMSENGVKILAGTDANIPVVVPGFSLHDELLALTRAGMTTSQALLSATVVPANWMKIKSGKILHDYCADLVLLNKNPLDNIENTKTIEMVIMNGKVFSRNQLDAILNAVKEANDISRNYEISSFCN